MSSRSDVAVYLADGSTIAEIMLVGRVDRQADALLGAVLDELLVVPRVLRIEIDTAMVQFCDRGGLTVFLRAQKQAADFGVVLHIVRAAPALLRVLEATGLSQLLTPAGS
ncbi:STAS domain-containing protein [Streptacidiphilus carbonis]|jgi:anti-anti-sigma factor|uniref:STAS domain-containing protein n=1 Tax=Streptacidiphilus carbonis TaxID=105422 RepID=UPI0005AB4841|nr:STAS domain-containing protein [Streptacidiphilus carbonis]